MSLDYQEIIAEESARIVAAYERDPSAAVPWSERWTVRTVARHVAGTHHVVAGIIQGRPDADFGLFNSLQTPAKDSGDFPAWSRAGSRALLEQLGSVPYDDECWSWFPPGSCVGWWARRMAHETVVHRFDTDAALHCEFSVEADIAADGVDEYLDVFVAATRASANAPAGPTVDLQCSDRDDRWWLTLSEEGHREVSREPRTASVSVRAPTTQLLLMLWGRSPWRNDGAVELSGEVEVFDRWAELVPPM